MRKQTRYLLIKISLEVLATFFFVVRRILVISHYFRFLFFCFHGDFTGLMDKAHK